MSEQTAKPKLTKAQAAVFAALQDGADIVMEKSPPYRWRYADDLKHPNIARTIINRLFEARLARGEEFSDRWNSRKLVVWGDKP